MDDLTPEQRHKNMSHIRSRDTKPEIIVRQFLFSKGLRYRIADKRYPGKPDIVLPKYRAAVFVHGCFWHGHEGCRYYVLPKTHPQYWVPKIQRNIERDAENEKSLQEMGWNVFTVWECQLKKDQREDTLNNLYKTIIDFEGGRNE